MNHQIDITKAVYIVVNKNIITKKRCLIWIIQEKEEEKFLHTMTILLEREYRATKIQV